MNNNNDSSAVMVDLSEVIIALFPNAENNSSAFWQKALNNSHSNKWLKLCVKNGGRMGTASALILTLRKRDAIPTP